MSFDLIEYYKALNGESSLGASTWHLNYDKRHAFIIYSDTEGYNPSVDGMFLPPSEEETKNVVNFSDLSGQKFNNTKITIETDGTEQVELELEDRVVTIVIDQSGSMAWNDSGNFRHEIAKDLVDKININYPGNVNYNLIEYGAKFISVLFFGLIDVEGVNPYDIDTLSAMFQADEDANYDGIRVVRNTTRYPTSPIDGEIIRDGFVSKILDSNLTEGQTYYYTIFTYDKDYRFSTGVNIKVVPRDRIVPRGVSIFRTTVETDDLSLGQPSIGSGVNRDDNTIGIWHMDEGEGRYLYDFSDSGLILSYTDESPVWYDTRFVPAGTSGLFFNGANYALVSDVNNLAEISFSGSDNQLTIGMWIYPYRLESIFISRDNGAVYNYALGCTATGALTCAFGAAGATSSIIKLDTYKWQYVALTYDGGADVIFYVAKDGELLSETKALSSSPVYTPSSYVCRIGQTGIGDYPFEGRITEVSVHNTARSNVYIQSQLVESPISVDGVEIGTEYIGIKDDNGDRLVVLDYEVPEDYNFSGGDVIIVKNEDHIPSWEEDGTIIYQVSASSGRFFVPDSDDFVIGEKYYYRIFSKNSSGNVSFSSDSPSLEVLIPTPDTDDYFVSLSSFIPPPEEPLSGQLITPGNQKAYLRWRQSTSIDPRISRVKIYYSSLSFPVVSEESGNIGELVFTGLPTDDKFVHRNLRNDVPAYYTIVNIDKYGRPSNFNSAGTQTSDHLQAATTPLSSADEGTIPLVDVENVHYELVDSNSITMGWDQPIKSPENVSAYFDQTVLLYASITDEFGAQMPEGALIKMYISADISRQTQAQDVFDTGDLREFQDIETYDFFVTRTDAGFMKATLRMTTDSRVISQVSGAVFTIQLKAYIPKEGGYTAPNTNTISTDPLSEYVSVVEGLLTDADGAEETASSENIFEYYSKPINVYFTNPWAITLGSRDEGQVVYQQCYIIKRDPVIKENVLMNPKEKFRGVHMKSSSPYVARAKITYKGEPVERGDLEVAVWDADFSELCAGASDDKAEWGVEGEALEISTTVTPPDGIMSILQGTEEGIGPTGEIIDVPVSYVDIPLYAPDKPHAVKLFVKGTKSGYSSVQSLYVLFQSILRMDLTVDSPNIGGQDIAEQRVSVFTVHPDYPDWDTSDRAASLTTVVDNNSIVQWEIEKIEGNNSRIIYSTDSVPLSNGVYSYTRNGMARNVFLGPIPTAGEEIDERHVIVSKIVYDGIADEARAQFDLEWSPTEYNRFGARFLMEIDGGWGNEGTDREAWGGVGWLNSDLNPLWADGSHYKRIKIHRDPVNSNFGSANAFNVCASEDDSQVMELNSGQIIQVITGDDQIEILHGDITEEVDPYTGQRYLSVKREGHIDNGSAFIELNDESVSDITYFYIRANKFVPGSGKVYTEYLVDEKPINKCLELLPQDGLFLRNLPRWNPYLTISGTTTLFVNDQPLVLRGGGDFYNGIPPCPVCLSEPLGIEVEWRRVTDYVYDAILGNPSNEFLYAIITEAEDNSFMDADEETLINHESDVDIRVKIQWKGRNVPDNTPVYTAIGDKTGNTLFVPSRNLYYTQIDEEEEYSYVDVRITARRIPTETTTENVEIYVVYDENGKTGRHIGANFSLTLDAKERIIEPPVVIVTEPSLVAELPGPDPFSPKLHRYDISDDSWSTLTSMSENKGDFFIGEANGKIYTMGGLKNNSLNISSKTEEYDIVADRWEDKTRMPNPRFGGMSVTIGNDIYLIGGFISDSSAQGLLVTNLVEVYHTNMDTWGTLEHMPIVLEGDAFQEDLKSAFGAAQHVTINYKNYIYVVGGMQDAIINSTTFKVEQYNERVLRYCVEDDEWEASGILRDNELSTYQRISPLTLTLDDKLIVFGGAIESDDNFVYPSEDFYINIESNFSNTPTDGYWVNSGSGLFGNFPVPKFQSAMIRYDEDPSVDTTSQYYIFGGGDNNAGSLDIVEDLSIVSSVATYNSSYNDNPSLALSPLPFAKHGAGAVYSDADGSPYAYIIGGYTSAQPNTFVDIEIDI